MAIGQQVWLTGGTAVAALGAAAVAAVVLWPAAPDPSGAAGLSGAPAAGYGATGPGAAGQSTSGSGVSGAGAEPVPAAGRSASGPGVQAAVPDLAAPRFDHVRIDADGSAVIAGRAAAHSRVRLLLDAAPLAETLAGADGQFALLVSLPPGRAPQRLELVVDRDGQSRSALLVVEPILLPAPPAGTDAASSAVEALAASSGAAPGDAGGGDGNAVLTPVEGAGDDAAASGAVAAAEAVGGADRESEVPAERPAGAVDLAVLPPADGGAGPAAVIAAVPAGAQEAPPQVSAGAVPPGTLPRGARMTGADPAGPVAIGTAELAGMPDPIPGDVAAGGSAPEQPADSALAAEAGPRAPGPARVPPGAAPPPLAADAAGASPRSATAAVPPAAAAAPVLPEPPAAPVPPVAGAGDVPLAPRAAAAAAAAAGAAPLPPLPPRVLMADDSGVRVVQQGGRPQVQDAGVVIDSIAYAPDGAVVLAGRGVAERFVRIYLDNSERAMAPVGADGHWSTGLPQVDTGIYTLRVDEIDSGGSVRSRSETPFLREDAAGIAADLAGRGAAPEAGAVSVVVQPGNTLWGIARSTWGEGVLYVRVFEANRDRIRNPDLIYPGQVFDLPAASAR